jgi:hypothetical protein
MLRTYDGHDYKHVIDAICKIKDVAETMESDKFKHEHEYTTEEYRIMMHPEAYLASAFAMDYNKNSIKSLIDCLKGAIE